LNQGDLDVPVMKTPRKMKTEINSQQIFLKSEVKAKDLMLLTNYDLKYHNHQRKRSLVVVIQ